MAAGEERRRYALVLSKVGRIRRRLNSEIGWRHAVVPLWCAATAVTLQRLLLREQTLVAAPVAFAVAGLWWWWRTRRESVGTAEAAVILDRQANAGGLLLTRLERPVGAWELGLNERIRRAPLPAVRRARSIGLASLALLFVGVVLWIPLPERKATVVNAAAASKIAEVEARAEALAREAPLEEGVEAELARLREELEAGRFDAADWEAADHLDASLAQKAAEAAAALARAKKAALALEEAMANAQDADSFAREREALESALMQLGDMGDGAEGAGSALETALAQLGGSDGAGSERASGAEGQDGESGSGEGQGGPGGENEANTKAGGDQGTDERSNGQQGEGAEGEGSRGQEAQGNQGGQQKAGDRGQSGQGKSPSRSQISELKRALAKRQEQLQRAYGQDGAPGQGGGQSGQMAQSQQAGQGGPGGGQSGQCEGGGDTNGQPGGACQGSGQSDGGGRAEGGVGRGGGPGELTFDNPNEVNPDRLAFAPLPKGQGGHEPGELWGLRAVDPKPGTERALGSGPSGAIVTGDQAPSHDQGALLPRNRELIRRYFDSDLER